MYILTRNARARTYTPKTPTAPPPQKGYMLPWASAAATARHAYHHTSPLPRHMRRHTPCARVVNITSPPRATSIPQHWRPHHVSSGHARAQPPLAPTRAPPTDVWPLRVPLIGAPTHVPLPRLVLM